ncbi:hypothetical protein [Microbacterium sp.]|uniref:hypothetical protein n=1 Tax=Microbacterium sp. TaxID=51671 RepID=UPI00334170D9
MNDTNRILNRGILLVVGIVLLVGGAAAVLAVAWPPATDVWTTQLKAAGEWTADVVARTWLAEQTTVSWAALAALILLAVLVVLSVVVIARLGRGSSGSLIREEGGEDGLGPITIGPGFASDAITHSLGRREEILSSRVSTRKVRGADVLQVSVTPRRNTPPAEVAATVTRLTDSLAALTGRELPVYVSIHAGVRTRLAADQPRVR